MAYTRPLRNPDYCHSIENVNKNHRRVRAVWRRKRSDLFVISLRDLKYYLWTLLSGIRNVHNYSLSPCDLFSFLSAGAIRILCKITRGTVDIIAHNSFPSRGWKRHLSSAELKNSSINHLKALVHVCEDDISKETSLI